MAGELDRRAFVRAAAALATGTRVEGRQTPLRRTRLVLLGTVASFKLPVEPVLVILGIDAVLDMLRTSVNVLGNCLATVVIARWEGEYQETPELATQAIE